MPATTNNAIQSPTNAFVATEPREIPDSFDPIWEELYSRGQRCRYPYDIVVTFVLRNYPREKPREEISILEVGCGAGNNVAFAAQEGFQVAGVDGSEAAIRFARDRFAEEGLMGDLRVADFTQLPFGDNSFDLVIDRGSLTCAGLSAGQRAVNEIWRVLRPAGRFLFNPYSHESTGASAGTPGPDGLTMEISAGTLVGVGQIAFYSRGDVENALGDKWNVLSFVNKVERELADDPATIHAEWRVVAEKRLTRDE